MEFAGAPILVVFAQEWDSTTAEPLSERQRAPANQAALAILMDLLRFRGQGGPLASPMFTTCYPHTPSPLLMKSWAWREFFASVFESKGLIGKVFQE